MTPKTFFKSIHEELAAYTAHVCFPFHQFWCVMTVLCKERMSSKELGLRKIWFIFLIFILCVSIGNLSFKIFYPHNIKWAIKEHNPFQFYGSLIVLLWLVGNWMAQWWPYGLLDFRKWEIMGSQEVELFFSCRFKCSLLSKAAVPTFVCMCARINVCMFGKPHFFVFQLGSE